MLTALVCLAAFLYALPFLALGVLVVLDRPMPRAWDADAEWLATMRGERDG